MSGHEPPSEATNGGAAEALADPDLAAVVKAWPELPRAVRAGILAMVRASGGEPAGDGSGGER